MCRLCQSPVVFRPYTVVVLTVVSVVAFVNCNKALIVAIIIIIIIIMSALRLAKPALRLRWQRPGSYANTQTFPIRTIFSRSLSRLWLHELFCGFLLPGFGPQNQPGLGGFTGSVLSFSSSVLQLPHNASTPFCFHDSFVAYESQTIQMSSHSSFWF